MHIYTDYKKVLKILENYFKGVYIKLEWSILLCDSGTYRCIGLKSRLSV